MNPTGNAPSEPFSYATIYNFVNILLVKMICIIKLYIVYKIEYTGYSMCKNFRQKPIKLN